MSDADATTDDDTAGADDGTVAPTATAVLPGRKPNSSTLRWLSGSWR